MNKNRLQAACAAVCNLMLLMCVPSHAGEGIDPQRVEVVFHDNFAGRDYFEILLDKMPFFSAGFDGAWFETSKVDCPADNPRGASEILNWTLTAARLQGSDIILDPGLCTKQHPWAIMYPKQNIPMDVIEIPVSRLKFQLTEGIGYWGRLSILVDGTVPILSKGGGSSCELLGDGPADNYGSRRLSQYEITLNEILRLGGTVDSKVSIRRSAFCSPGDPSKKHAVYTAPTFGESKALSELRELSEPRKFR